jgi:hypothetical protein
MSNSQSPPFQLLLRSAQIEQYPPPRGCSIAQTAVLAAKVLNPTDLQAFKQLLRPWPQAGVLYDHLEVLDGAAFFFRKSSRSFFTFSRFTTFSFNKAHAVRCAEAALRCVDGITRELKERSLAARRSANPLGDDEAGLVYLLSTLVENLALIIIRPSLLWLRPTWAENRRMAAQPVDYVSSFLQDACCEVCFNSAEKCLNADGQVRCNLATLPPEMRDALQRLGYGCIASVHLQVDPATPAGLIAGAATAGLAGDAVNSPAALRQFSVVQTPSLRGFNDNSQRWPSPDVDEIDYTLIRILLDGATALHAHTRTLEIQRYVGRLVIAAPNVHLRDDQSLLRAAVRCSACGAAVTLGARMMTVTTTVDDVRRDGQRHPRPHLHASNLPDDTRDTATVAGLACFTVLGEHAETASCPSLGPAAEPADAAVALPPAAESAGTMTPISLIS